MADWCQRYRSRGEQHWKEQIPQDQAESRYRILRPMVEIQSGDRIVIPKVPTWNSFCIAVAKGSYEFDVSKRTDPEHDDFRHVIPLQSDLRIVPYLSNVDAQIVVSSFGGFQRAVNRVHKQIVRDAIETLIKIESPATSGDAAALWNEMGRAATERTVDEIVSKLTGLQNNVFEQLIQKLVKLGGYQVLKTNQFDREGGDIDIVAKAEMPSLATVFEHESILLMQVKKKKQLDPDDIDAVNQLVRMAQTYPGASLVVVSTADKFTPACVSAAEANGVVLISGRTLARLLLRYMS
jgi:hypothetical protein